MRGKPFVRQHGDNVFAVRFVGSQGDLLRAVLSWVTGRRVGEAAALILAGTDTSQLETLGERLGNAGENLYSVDELHILHASLLSAHSMFPSEQDFHYKLGFYRDPRLASASSARRRRKQVGRKWPGGRAPRGIVRG